jgi:hypothetical protein
MEYYCDTIPLPLRRVQGVLVKNYPKFKKNLFIGQPLKTIEDNFYCPQIKQITQK